jgi:asparagine synthase (glutamine-hydrolysing)
MEGASQAGVKVMLDGQGADELLGGYPHYRYAWLLGLGRARPTAIPAALHALRRLGMRPGVALRQALLAGLQLGKQGIAPIGRDSRPPAWLGATLRAAEPLPLRDAGHPSPDGTPLARHLRRAALTTSLPALLRYEDRNSMRFGIEARVPFLDHRVVEAAMLLPDRLKISNGITKAVLRRTGIGRIPERIRTERRKIGFATPQGAWLDERRGGITDAFVGSRAVEAGYLDRRGIDELLARPLADDGTALWRCLSLELWLRALA